MPTVAASPDNLTCRGAAERLGITSYALLRLASTGRIRAIPRHAETLSFSEADVDALAIELARDEKLPDKRRGRPRVERAT
jgi:predicted site-specific integrase-resolvase